MEGRTSTTIALIGLVGNLAVLVVVLMMLTALDDRPVAALGLGITPRDGVVLAGFVALTAARSAGFLAIGERRGWLHVQRRTEPNASGPVPG